MRKRWGDAPPLPTKPNECWVPDYGQGLLTLLGQWSCEHGPVRLPANVIHVHLPKRPPSIAYVGLPIAKLRTP